MQKIILRLRGRANDHVTSEHRTREKRHQMARHRCPNSQYGPWRFRIHRRFFPNTTQYSPQLRWTVVRDFNVCRVLVRLSINIGQQYHRRT